MSRSFKRNNKHENNSGFARGKRTSYYNTEIEGVVSRRDKKLAKRIRKKEAELST